MRIEFGYTQRSKNRLLTKSIVLLIKMTPLKLNHFSQQPVWLRDNHYLHNNHRAPTQSYLMCLRSCFMLHTETMNIWWVSTVSSEVGHVKKTTQLTWESSMEFSRTHLIPCFLFIFLILKTMGSEGLSIPDKLAIGLFLLGAFLCHMFSTAFHAFSCHSERVGKFFQKWVSFFRSYKFAFAHCWPHN